MKRLGIAILTFLLFTAGSGNALQAQGWGDQGRRPGQFNEPFDVAVDAAGFVYVTDVRNRRVQKFSADGQFILAFGQEYVSKPSGIGIGPDGSVWVTDFNNDQVFQFDPKGRLLNQFGEPGEGPGQFDSPVDVAVATNGDLFVVDEYHHRIQKFGPNGKFILTWGQQGKVNVVRSALNFLLPTDHKGDFQYPSRIAIGPDGRVFVADAYNNRVQVFDTNGQFLSSIGGMGVWGGRFRVAAGLDIGPNGELFVADFYNNRIQRFDQDGVFLESWGHAGSGAEQLSGPTGVGLDTQGRVFITDWGNHRIQVWQLAERHN